VRQVSRMEPKLPGLPTFSALMLSAVLTAWLGLWGPIEFAKLEKWQTLLTGVIALAAALIAYRAAMSKVRYDEEREQRDLLRKKLGIYVRVSEAADLVAAEAHHAMRALNMSTPDNDRIHSLRISAPPEFEEAWQNIDLFPLDLVRHISMIRAKFRQVDKTINRSSKEEVLQKIFSSEELLNFCRTQFRLISDRGFELEQGLNKEIEKMTMD
jgi:hypothetical protein